GQPDLPGPRRHRARRGSVLRRGARRVRRRRGDRAARGARRARARAGRARGDTGRVGRRGTAGEVPLHGAQLPQPGRRDARTRAARGDRRALRAVRPADHRGQPVRVARLRRPDAADAEIARAGPGGLPRLVLQDVRVRCAGRVGVRAAGDPGQARAAVRVAGALPADAVPAGRGRIPVHPAVAGADQDLPGALPGAAGRDARRARRAHAARLHVDEARGRLLRLADPAGGPRREGHAAAWHRRAGRVRPRHRLLRRRRRRAGDAAVVLLPDAGADPRGGAEAGRRGRAGARAARDLPRHVAGVRPVALAAGLRPRPGAGVSTRVGELTAVVLAGGLAYEREVSLHSGRRVCEALKQAGVAVRMLDPDGELLAGLSVDRPDAVFIALHGADGEDGALRSVLDLADVPYVGSDAAACRMAWDKPTAKAIVHAAGLTTPDWVALPHSTFRELGAAVVLDRIVERFGLPLMVKP